MTPRDYLLDRLPLLLAFAVALGFLLLVVHLSVGPLTSGEASYIALLALVATGVILAVDYQRHRRFRGAVAERLDPASSTDLSPLPRGATREQRAVAELLSESQRKMLAELQRHQTAAEEHRAFVDLWVHQMKTPLAVLELTAQQELADDDRAGSWASVAEEVDQLSHGLELMLSAARLEHFELDLQPATVDLAAAAREAVNDLKRSWLRSGVYPRIEPPEQPLEVETDPKWLQVVLRQLLSNALKYSDEGQSVTVRLAPDAGGARLEVVDEGVGIPEEDLPRVFERFFTGSNVRRGQASTGMGLYLAAEISRRLGHVLELESRPGEGTTATLRILPRGVHRLGGQGHEPST